MPMATRFGARPPMPRNRGIPAEMGWHLVTIHGPKRASTPVQGAEVRAEKFGEKFSGSSPGGALPWNSKNRVISREIRQLPAASSDVMLSLAGDEVFL